MNVSGLPSCNSFQMQAPESVKAQKILCILAVIVMIGSLIGAGFLFSCLGNISLGPLGYVTLGLGVISFIIGGVLMTLGRGYCCPQERKMERKRPEAGTPPESTPRHLNKPLVSNTIHDITHTTQDTTHINKPLASNTIHDTAHTAQTIQISGDNVSPIAGTHYLITTVRGVPGIVVGAGFESFIREVGEEEVRSCIDNASDYDWGDGVMCRFIPGDNSVSFMSSLQIPVEKDRSCHLPGGQYFAPVPKKQTPPAFIVPQDGKHFVRGTNHENFESRTINGYFHLKLLRGQVKGYYARSVVYNGEQCFELTVQKSTESEVVLDEGSSMGNPFGFLERVKIPAKEESLYRLPLPLLPVRDSKGPKPQPMTLHTDPEEGVHFRVAKDEKSCLISSKVYELIKDDPSLQNNANGAYVFFKETEEQYCIVPGKQFNAVHGWTPLRKVLECVSFPDEPSYRLPEEKF